MGQAELIKIKTMVGDYRQFKLKFIQFVKHCQQLARDNNLPEISGGRNPGQRHHLGGDGSIRYRAASV